MVRKWSSLAALGSVFSASAIADCPPPVSVSEMDVYPSAESVPANLLRFYLYFPRSMGREISASDIRLVKSDGSEISQAFLPMRYELWSSDRRRLTLILDPGRVKTGLSSHDMRGRALVVGENFALQVSRTLKDSDGCDLGADLSFGFSVLPASLKPLLPQTWSIEVPASGTRAALKLDLGHPHDHLSMAYRIRIQTEDGQPIAGEVKLAEEESVWVFVPRDNWSPVEHKIIIDERLEDLAGNRPGVPFDRKIDAPQKNEVRELTFVPRY